MKHVGHVHTLRLEAASCGFTFAVFIHCHKCEKTTFKELELTTLNHFPPQTGSILNITTATLIV